MFYIALLFIGRGYLLLPASLNFLSLLLKILLRIKREINYSILLCLPLESNSKIEDTDNSFTAFSQVDICLRTMPLIYTRKTSIVSGSKSHNFYGFRTNIISRKLALSSYAICSLLVFGTPHFKAILAIRHFSHNFKMAAANP